MTYIDVIVIVLSIALGWVIGNMIVEFLFPLNGEIVIDTSDPEKDKWLIILEEPTPIAARRHRVKLKVVHRQLKEGDEWPYET